MDFCIIFASVARRIEKNQQAINVFLNLLFSVMEVYIQKIRQEILR
jgi:hypothetical protein